MREKYFIGGEDRRSMRHNKVDPDFAVQFDETRGEVMFRSALNHSDKLDALVFGLLKMRGCPVQVKSGVHLKIYYRYVFKCTRLTFRCILIIIKGKYPIFKTSKLWRK